MSDHIVVIDPDPDFVARVTGHLRAGGARITGLDTIRAFVPHANAADPALVVVSLDAADDLRSLSEWLRVTVEGKSAVLLVVPEHTLPEASAGFAGRVDDFITRPVDRNELRLRVARLTGRSRASVRGPRVGPLAFDAAAHAIRADGAILNLSPIELRLMVFFLERPDRAFTRAELLRKVWDNGIAITERTVDVTIRRLRSVLADHDCAGMIQTVRGVGYRFAETTASAPKRRKSTG